MRLFEGFTNLFSGFFVAAAIESGTVCEVLQFYAFLEHGGFDDYDVPLVCKSVLPINIFGFLILM